MPTISVQERIHAPVERVFEAVSDHVRLVRMAGIETKILRTGDRDPAGVGCVREVRVRPGIRFVEEITAWEPPHGYTYQITSSSLPMDHEGSRLSLVERDGATEVTWSGVARLTIPVIGGVLEGPFVRSLERSFATMLAQVKAELESR